MHVTRAMAVFALWLASQSLALAGEAMPEKGKEGVGGAEKQAKALYQEAARACEKGDLRKCVEQLSKAIAASEEAILWANENKADHFASIVLLDEDSPVRREFVGLIDLANYDKKLRESIKAKCQQAAKEGKRVLLDFYGGW